MTFKNQICCPDCNDDYKDIVDGPILSCKKGGECPCHRPLSVNADDKTSMRDKMGGV